MTPPATTSLLRICRDPIEPGDIVTREAAIELLSRRTRRFSDAPPRACNVDGGTLGCVRADADKLVIVELRRLDFALRLYSHSVSGH